MAGEAVSSDSEDIEEQGEEEIDEIQSSGDELLQEEEGEAE